MITLRENQHEAVKVACDYFKKENAPPSIIVLPTAWGKSILTAFVAKDIQGKLLVLQPTKELLEQNYNKFIQMGGYGAIYSASFNSKRIGDITYATIGSIKNIGKTFKELGFKYLLIDEAHLYPREADSMFGGFLRDSEITHVLGITATPLKLQSNSDAMGNRFSKLVMLTSRSKKGNFFKEIIHVGQIDEMVKLGFWSKLKYQREHFDESQLEYNSTKAEFTEESIQKSYETQDIGGRVIREVKKNSDRKSILVFVPSVADAKRLAGITPDAVAVYGDMPKKERERAINDFREQKKRVVFNVNVLSTGFDYPCIDCIIMARATASLSWYYQAMGRGTRIHPTKEDCLIIDFSGNVGRFGEVEKFYYKKENVWKLYGENGKLLTGIPLHEIGLHKEGDGVTGGSKIDTMPFGMHKGKKIAQIPKSYITWMLENFKWDDRNRNLKKALEAQLQKWASQLAL